MTSKKTPRNVRNEFGHTPVHAHGYLPASESHTHGTDTMATYEVSGTKRKRRLKHMFWISLVITALSIGAMIVGTLAMIENSEFPYIMNSAGIAGVACLISTTLTICLVQMGRKAETFAELPSSFRSMFYCGMVTLGFTWLFIALGFGLGGVWGTLDCVRTIRSHSMLHLCKGDAHKLFALSVVTLVLMCVIAICVFILHCMYCYSQRGLQSDMFILKQDDSVDEMVVLPQDGVKRLRDYCDTRASVGRTTPSSQDSQHDTRHREDRLAHDHRVQGHHRIPHDDNDRSIKPRYDDYSHDRRHRDNRHSDDYRHAHKDTYDSHRHSNDSRSDSDISDADHHQTRYASRQGDCRRSHKEPQNLKSLDHRSGHGAHFTDHRLEHDRHSYDQRSRYSERSSNHSYTRDDRRSQGQDMYSDHRRTTSHRDRDSRSSHDDRRSQSQNRYSDYRHSTNHGDRDYRSCHEDHHRAHSDNRSHHPKRTTTSSLDDRPPSYRDVVRTAV